MHSEAYAYAANALSAGPHQKTCGSTRVGHLMCFSEMYFRSTKQVLYDICRTSATQKCAPDTSKKQNSAFLPNPI